MGRAINIYQRRNGRNLFHNISTLTFVMELRGMGKAWIGHCLTGNKNVSIRLVNRDRLGELICGHSETNLP